MPVLLLNINVNLPDEDVKYLYCNTCNKQVSTGFFPMPTETPDRGVIIRAYIECLECVEKRIK